MDFKKMLGYYELGLKVVLPLAMAYVYLFPASDAVPLYWDWVKGQVPYGVLWTWLNPYYWVGDFYQYMIFLAVIAMTAVNWVFVKRGRMPKWVFYGGWLTSILWMRTGVYQNVTVTLFAPLAFVFPFLILFPLLQKIPIGWSFPDMTANAHWRCAFGGTQPYSDVSSPTGLMCSSAAVRWDPFLPYLYSYFVIAFWVLAPMAYWYARWWLEEGDGEK
jgi:hypothetical protein